MENDKSKSRQLAPEGRTHWPVLSVDYKPIDEQAGYGDACFMDIGQSTWNKEEYSVKLWRWAAQGSRWSRLSEELPLSRVLDLAILVSAAVTGKTSMLQEFYQKEDQKEALQSFMTENMQVLGPKLDELRQVLSPALPQNIHGLNTPNIFSFATSELSQDAMFAWLLSWAAPQCGDHDPSLHAVAVKFVKMLTGLDTLEIKSVTVGRQWQHIDVWAEINDDIILSIEDKTGTSIHDEQLHRYKSIVEEEYPSRLKCYAYVKTGNEPESILQEVKSTGYRVILRNDILSCLNEYSGNNMMVCNYRDYLLRLEQATQGFRNLPVAQWTWNAWEGFYKELEKEGIIDGSWGYVANPSGGFLGAWWHGIDFSSAGGQMYLQFEQGDLCIKICPSCAKTDRSRVRQKCYDALMKMVKTQFPEIHKPSRFGAGQYMTIAKVSSKDLFGEGIINFPGIIGKINEYENIITECCRTV